MIICLSAVKSFEDKAPTLPRISSVDVISVTTACCNFSLVTLEVTSSYLDSSDHLMVSPTLSRPAMLALPMFKKPPKLVAWSAPNKSLRKESKPSASNLTVSAKSKDTVEPISDFKAPSV